MTSVSPSSAVPPFDAAWVAREAKTLSNWGRWGEDDQIGAWNLVDSAKVREASRCVRTGEVISLSLPFGPSGPSAQGAAGRPNAVHLMQMTGSDVAVGAQDRAFPGSGKFADDWVIMNLSTSTQWDGLCHVFHDGFAYNGVPAAEVSSRGARRNSITALRDRTVTRGVLLDLPRVRGVDWLESGVPIQPEDLDAAVAAHGCSVRPGDAILIRTGHLAQFRAAGTWDGYAGTGPAPGLGVRCARWLAGHDIAAVACDTWGLEVLPYETQDTIAPLHQIVLTHCGITIGEMFDLEQLAAACAEDGVYDCLLVGPVLPLDGAINTPVNPLAVR
jgi:kynurenine formamidase